MAICETQQKNNKVYTQLGGKSLDGVKIAHKKNVCSFLSFQTAKLFNVPGHRRQCCVISVHNVNGLVLGHHQLYFGPLLPHCTFR